MKRITTLSIAALMGATLLASPAISQVSIGGESGVGVQAESGKTSETGVGTSLDTGTTAAIGGTFDGALSAIDRNSDSSAAIASMTEVSSVNVVRVGDLEGADMTTLDTAMSENSAEIDELRAAIEANAALQSALEAESVDASSVVAADVAADGSLTVFVR